MTVTLNGIISVNGIDYCAIDQDISIQEYSAGDQVRWIRDGDTVATTPTYRISEADVRADGSLCLIRGSLKKSTWPSFQTHVKPVYPIIYPTKMGVPAPDGRRVDENGKPFLRLRPTSEDGHCGINANVTVGRGARYVFVDGAPGAGSDTAYNGSSPWPGYECIVDSATGQISKGAASGATPKAGPFATITKGVTRINGFGGGNDGPDAKLAGDWCVVLNSVVYDAGFEQIGSKGGYSPAYPTVYTSADAADPADMSKWGVVRTSISSRLASSNTGDATGAARRNYVLMGFSIDDTASPTKSAYNNNTDYLLFWNCSFAQSAQTYQAPAPYLGTVHVWWVHCGFGPTYNYAETPGGEDHTQCLYVETPRYARGTSEIGIYSCYFYHGGWMGNRDEFPGYGASTKSHGTYFSQYCGPIDSYNCVYSDSSYAGGMHRPGGRIVNNVCIRNAAHFLPGISGGKGFNNSVQDWPVQFHNNLLISAVDLRSDQPRCIGVVVSGSTDGSKLKGNLIYTGDTVAQRDTSEITVAASYNHPCYLDVSFNTQILRSSANPPQIPPFVTFGIDQNVTLGLTHRTDDMNIYNGVSVLNPSNVMTMLAPSGSSIDSRTVSWPTPPNENVLAQAMGFIDYADMAVAAVANPLRRWAAEHIGNALAGCVPPATDSRLFVGTKVLGAVTPGAYWNDGSNIDANGYPTGAYYDPSAQGLFDRMSGDPDGQRKAAINALIVALKDAGIWNVLDALYVAQGTAGDNLLNWKSTSYALTPTNSPIYLIDRYFSGNGTNAYYDTGFGPSTAGGSFAQDQAHAGVVLKTYVAGQYYFGNSAGTVMIAAPSTRVTGRANGANLTGAAGATAPGHYVINRNGPSDVQLYMDGALNSSSSSNASTALSSGSLRICAVTTSSSSTAEIAAAHFGGALTAPQQADLADAVADFLAAIRNG